MAWEQLLYGAPKPPDAVGSFLTGHREATANAENSYNLYQKRKLQELMSDRSIYKADNTIDYDLLQVRAAQAGIAKTALDEANNQLARKWEVPAKIAENKVNLDLYGIDLDEAKPQVQGGLPMPTAENPAPVGASWTDAWDNPDQSAIGESAPKVEVPEGRAMNLGSTTLPGNNNWLDQYFPVEPKTQGWFDKVDTMKPKISGLNDTSGPGDALGGTIDDIDYATLAADPERKARMDQYLASLGIKDAGQSGIDAMIAKIRASIPDPVVNKAALSVGKKERAEEIGRVTQGRADAEAKRQAAINAFRDGIMGNLGTLQAQDLSRRADARAETDQGYDLAGQRDEDIFARKVSASEAAKVKVLRAAINDIAEADVSTFGGIYKMAKAKSIVDGNGTVTEAAILAYLVEAGAIPSSDALVLKSFMSPDGNIGAEGIKWLTSKGYNAIVPQNIEQAKRFQRQSIDNTNKTIVDNGGREVKFFTDGTIAMIDGAPAVYKGGKWIRLKAKKQ